MAATATITTPADVASEFLDRLRELYDDIKQWISEEDPKAKFTETNVVLNEQFAGRFKAKSLKVSRSGMPTLTFVPKAATVLGARGWVEVESPWGSEDLFWIEAGGPAILFEESADGGVAIFLGRRYYPRVPEGWAWDEGAKLPFRHLTRDVFFKRVVRRLSE